MFAAERRNKIRDIMLEYRHVDVNTLCALLGVSIATVRRDLDQLEKEGFLVKEHGGALLSEQAQEGEVSINISADMLGPEKRAIARLAVQLVGENEAIFVGSGSTCLCFARELPAGRNLIVVTCNIHAAMETVGKPGISTVLLGGDMRLIDGMTATFGIYAEANINNMFIDKAFLSAQGAAIPAGYTLSSREQVSLYKAVMGRADQSIMLMDYTKFGKRAFMPLASLDQVGTVVSNMRLSDQYKEHFAQTGVKLFTAIE